MNDRPELDAFNRLVAGRLKIVLSKPPEQIAPNLENLKAPAGASIEQLRFAAEVFENDGFRALTGDELDRLAFDAPSIALRGEGEEFVSCEAPNGTHFTVRDLVGR